MKSTIALFNQYGPMVPVSKISEHAGVAAGTPFRYFKTKDELLRATYDHALNSSYDVIHDDPRDQPDTERMIKTIIRGIIEWAAVMPAEHEYVIKYEDAVCYNCFDPAFNDLYEGIVEVLGIWERMKDDVRADIPPQVINRMISVQCSVFIRYMSYHKIALHTPEADYLIEASADSIWRSIQKV